MSITRQNNIWTGAALAAVLPVMAFGILLMLFEWVTDAGWIDAVADPMGGRRLRTLTLFSLCANVVLMKIYNKRFTQDTLRGVLIITFVGAAVWIVCFYQDVLADF